MIYDLQPKYEFWLMICCVLQIYSYFWQCRQCPPLIAWEPGAGRGREGFAKKYRICPRNLGNLETYLKSLKKRGEKYRDIHRYVGLWRNP